MKRQDASHIENLFLNNPPPQDASVARCSLCFSSIHRAGESLCIIRQLLAVFSQEWSIFLDFPHTKGICYHRVVDVMDTLNLFMLFIHLRFYIASNTVKVISRRVFFVGRGSQCIQLVKVSVL